jgi:hypothetical protein
MSKPKSPAAGVSLKAGDGIILLFALAVLVFSARAIYAGSGRQTEVIIEGSGGRWIFPLDAEELVSVAGPLGDTTVELRGGRARVLSSPCTNRLCMAAGAIGAHGQWIACLPNKVLVRVDSGGGGEESDATTW